MRRKPASILTVIILVVLIGYMAFTLVGLYQKISAAQAEKTRLAQEIRSQQEENDAMAYAVAHQEDDRVIADVARRELGLVYPDETIYYTR